MLCSAKEAVLVSWEEAFLRSLLCVVMGKPLTRLTVKHRDAAQPR